MPGPGLQILQRQGTRIAFRVDGKGPPLVMIQGVGAQGTSANPQIAVLQNYFTCLTFDSSGIGQSVPFNGELTVKGMAADTAALMDHLGWDSAHIIGHSLGGLVALQFALDARPRVRSLTLLCSFARGSDVTKPTAGLLWILLRIRAGTRRMRRRAFMELVLSERERIGDEDQILRKLSGVLGHDVADIPEITTRQVIAMKNHDVTDRLRELAGIPTLVMNGTEDPIAPPKAGRAIAAGIPGARYIEFSGTSHALPIFRAEECARKTLAHLQDAEVLRRKGQRS